MENIGKQSRDRVDTEIQGRGRQLFYNPIGAYLSFRRAKIITAEPVLFLYMFGMFMSLSVGQEYIFNWYGRKMLREHDYTGPFNFCMSTDILNEIPRNLTHGKKAGDIVQGQASILSLGTTLIGQLPSIFAALVYGPLTDRIGRRPIMLLMGSAGALSGLLFTLAVYFSWSIFWFIPLTLITSLTGGIPGILTVVYSYIADVSSTQWQCILVSTVFGTVSSLHPTSGLALTVTRGKMILPVYVNAELGWLQAFRMYGGIGMSASSLHRESTDSLILQYYVSGHPIVYRYRHVYSYTMSS